MGENQRTMEKKGEKRVLILLLKLELVLSLEASLGNIAPKVQLMLVGIDGSEVPTTLEITNAAVRDVQEVFVYEHNFQEHVCNPFPSILTVGNFDIMSDLREIPLGTKGIIPNRKGNAWQIANLGDH
ncbi:hypothetical protein JHK87_031043 [Glycine soja]|nr:hypothetical protein JHK87_031043 [Glycine soja]